MSLSRGRNHRATPGPSIIPDRVLRAMHKPAPNIYEGKIISVTESILADLAKFAMTEGNVALYVANGHGAWEAAITNLFEIEDTILVLSTGHFGKGWAELAQKLGIRTIILDFGFEATVNYKKLKKLLSEDTRHKIKAVLAVQTDTSSSVLNDVKKIRHTIDSVKHPALFLIDSIACFGCDRLEMDEWRVDVMVTACQKGLMTPPGISYCFVNDKAFQFSKQKKFVPPYWDWKPRINPKAFYERFFGTAPTNHLFGQREALDMMLEEGRENIFRRHKILAEAIWIAIDHWSMKEVIKPNILNRSCRSTAVTTFRADGHDLTPLRNWLKHTAGLELGFGVGFFGTKYLDGKSVCRIAHMGHLNPIMILGVITSIEAGLAACNIPFGKGGPEAAADFISKNFY